ncbi:MAG TPA: hypothetical protein VKQ36_07050 [Ktedonobacterales bacterium]|nr:hypothetical protein [Ktedonobacterales bacterium]
MDDPENLSPFALPEEYALLGNPRRVMREVVALLGDLHQAVWRLGDELVSAGLPARAWRSDDAWLDLLSERLPALTLDEFITRLSRFAADGAAQLLHGDEQDIATFGELIAEWSEQASILRVVAHRLRLSGVSTQGEQRLAEALASARISAPLDRLFDALRDLAALQPFLAPLTRDEWDSLDFSEAPPEAKMAEPAPSLTDETTRPLTPEEARQTTQSFHRLRDFAPTQTAALDETAPVMAPNMANGAHQPITRLSDAAEALLASLPNSLRVPLRWAMTHRLATTLAVIVLLATGLIFVEYLAGAFVGR